MTDATMVSAPDDAGVRELARVAVAAILAAGKVTHASPFDAVRFQAPAAVPAWALRGAWEEQRPTPLPPPVEPVAPTPSGEDGQWTGTGEAMSDPPDVLRGWASPEVDELPTIQIKAGGLLVQVGATIDALSATDRNLFQRDGALVTIVRQPERTEFVLCDGRPSVATGCGSCGSDRGASCVRDHRRGSDILTRPGTPRVRTMNPAMLLLRSATHARWEKFDARRGAGAAGERKGEWVTADPCGKTVQIVHGLGDWPGVRPLRGILETPALAPSMRVIEAPGYDEETGYLLLPSCKIAPIAPRPTQAQARSALRYLWIEMACDFPFRGMGEPTSSDPDRVLQFRKALDCPDAFVGIAMLLTIFARPAIVGAVPGGLFEAAGQGSGKSMQMHTVAIVATSRPAGVATFPMRDGKPDEIELEKILAGYALNAARIVAFDNIKGVLTGANLEKILTAVDSIDLRVLGANDQRTLPWPATSLFSGNNLTMSDDIAQRMLLSRLVSRREDPRSRPANTFRHPELLSAIRACRAQLVRAVLTILRAFVCAREDGVPVPDPGTLGSFEAWSRIIPPALMFAGGPNILRARPEGGRGGDDESQAHTALMRGWREDWQGQKSSYIAEQAFKAEREIVQGKAPSDGLDEMRAAIRMITKTHDRAIPSGHILGIYLGRLLDKVRGGLRIERETDSVSKASLWRVVVEENPS